MHIVMLAAENAALKGGKVGGIGDVIRDVPRALAALGHEVSVIMPAYQALARLNPSYEIARLPVRFCGRDESVQVLAADVSSRKSSASPEKGRVTTYLLDHPVFAACGAGAIYCNDQNGPFATDAHKFALFCAAAGDLLLRQLRPDTAHAGLPGRPDVIHLHDWHAAMFAVLRAYDPGWEPLREIRTVYSIHNLSLQGIRPLRGHESSPLNWFPDLRLDLGALVDPRYGDCINLMRAGIRLSDRVHAVSPSYAREILQSSDPSHGFFGGEGLEADLQQAEAQGRLTGILNGCDYSELPPAREDRSRILALAEASLRHWVAGHDVVPAAHFHALSRILQWRKRRRPVPLSLTSIGRITDQKVGLLALHAPGREENPSSPYCTLEQLLDELGDGELIMLGSGDERHEHFFTRLMAARENFLFLRGFSEDLAEALYGYGDLFLMPSTYEPCGISQMLAMRAGTPCVVHHVGGLRDTVAHEVNGFAFTGNTPKEQAAAMLGMIRHAAQVKDTKKWPVIRAAAAASRFTWDASMQRYLSELYT